MVGSRAGAALAVALLAAAPTHGWRCFTSVQISVAGTGPFAPFGATEVNLCPFYAEDSPRSNQDKPMDIKGYVKLHLDFEPLPNPTTISVLYKPDDASETVLTEVVLPAQATASGWFDVGNSVPVSTQREWAERLKAMTFSCDPSCSKITKVASYVVQCDCREGFKNDQCNLAASSWPLNEFSCTACEPGTYQDEWAQAECKACPAGTEQPLTGQNSSAACVPCSKESTYSTGGLETCLPCARGTTNIANFTACEPCPEGMITTEDGGVCQLCGAGFFTTDNIECEACDLGQSSNTARTGCVDCQAGTYADEPLAECKPCPKDTFMPDPRAEKCTPCEAGFHKDAEGSTEECDACPAGSYGFVGDNGRGTCGECPRGQVQAEEGQTKCETCLQGTEPNEARTACESCAKGSFGRSVNQGVCEQCDAGLFQDETGQTQCKVCPGGTWSEEGASECSECPIGTFSRSGAIECTKCPEGEITDKPGQEACVKCTNADCSAASANAPALVAAIVAASWRHAVAA